jgi:hypothetical protein
MDENIDALKRKAVSRDLEESVEGIEHLVKVGDKITDTLLESLAISENRFVTTERISLFFHTYIIRLKEILSNTDKDLSFWAASLIIHYNINDNSAERILLDAVLYDTLDKAYIATTILCRVRNPQVLKAISERIKDVTLTNEAKQFFTEKANDF